MTVTVAHSDAGSDTFFATAKSGIRFIRLKKPHGIADGEFHDGKGGHYGRYDAGFLLGLSQRGKPH